MQSKRPSGNAAKDKWREEQSWRRYEAKFWEVFTEPQALSPRVIAAAHQRSAPATVAAADLTASNVAGLSGTDK